MKTTLSIICLITMFCVSCVATGEQQVKADPQPEAAFTITKTDIATLNAELDQAAAAVGNLPAYNQWIKEKNDFDKRASNFVLQSEMGKAWIERDKTLRSKWDQTPEFKRLQELRARAKMYKDLLKTTKE